MLADGRRLLAADFHAESDAAGQVFYACALPDLSLQLSLSGGGPLLTPGDRRTLMITNTGAAPVALAEALVHCAEEPTAPPPAETAMWIHARQMNEPTLVHRFAEGEAHPTYAATFRGEGADSVCYTSAWMSVFAPKAGGAAELWGFVTTGRQFGEIRWTVTADERGSLRREAACLLDGHLLEPGESVTSETLLCLRGDDPLALVDAYAQAVAATMQARVPARSPAGWCSWYFYWNRVSEADILTNLAALRRDPGGVEVVQIDDGFQSHTGDWLTPNARFPSGMAALAARIRGAGFTPGLWLAPFVMHRDSVVLREHPEWAIRNRDGSIRLLQTWLGECAALDCTHPVAQAWLREVVGTAVRGWGYSYLKLDALVFAAQSDAVYQAPNTTAAANLRRGLEVIRAAAGDETFLLGCTCPFGPAIGLVDAMRVGPDVDALWFNGQRPSAFHALRTTLPRWFMHRRFWVNDPDCLVARDTQSELTLEEVRTLATGIAISGGAVLLSDDLAALSPARRALAESVLPPYGVAARPLDLFARELPRVFTLDQTPPRAGRRVVALFNWADEPAEIGVAFAEIGITPGARQHVFEFWERLYLGSLADGIPPERIAPHSCRLYLLTPDGGAPAVVGAAAHTSMGGLAIAAETWDGARRELQIRLDTRWQRPNSLYVALPDALRDAGFRASGAVTLARGGAVLRLDTDPSAGHEITVVFDR